MTLEEAFYKQKDELHAAQREVKKLTKELETSRKGVATDKKIQEQLSHIRGLNNKVSELTGISERYKELYEQEKIKVGELSDIRFTLELEILQLKERLSFYEAGPSERKIAELDEANAQIEALKEEVSRLTARIEHNGSNTGIPTSKTAIGQKKVIPNSRKKTVRSKGGQYGHEKHTMPRFSDEEITETVTHGLSVCPKCGSTDLEEINITNRDEYDYEVEVIKRRHRFIEYVCLDCGTTVRAPLNGLVAPNQYGRTIQAMALTLMNVGFVSVNRTRKILSGLSPDSISLCEGYLIKLQKRYSKKLQFFVSDVKKYMVGVPLLYWDDTVVFINTSRACMRFYGDGSVTLYTAHEHKDLDSIMSDNILPALSEGTTVMHDHNSINYHEGFVFRNVECLQHIERDLQKLADDSRHKWPADMRDLIAATIHKRKALIENGILSFDIDEIDQILGKVRTILDDGYKEYMGDLGHYFECDERALLNRIRQYEDNYFEWIRNFAIPTTNNLSERSFRFAKTKDKISGQFESVDYAKFFADIRTYLGTCASNGINEFSALLRLTGGDPFTLSEILERAG
ncbi:MAG: transposase [Lachnospiraceae bacterium]|nr:transposase [Lachnospiraceae bacterium]